MPKYPQIINRNITFDLFYSDDPSFSGDTKYTDKGIDFKIRLFEESYWLPETAIGVRDFGGTGLFDGEFIAASKHIGPFDFTVGVGWGYMGNSGNLSGDKTISNDCGRDTSYKGKGGSVNFERWFTDCSAVFGGVEYQSPWAPLRLKAEYDGNDYISDFPVTRGGVDMTQDSKFNYGMLYRFGNWGDMPIGCNLPKICIRLSGMKIRRFTPLTIRSLLLHHKPNTATVMKRISVPRQSLQTNRPRPKNTV